MSTQTRPPRGQARDRILDLAETAVLAKGFGATSIDELIAGAGITKGGFFYHFREKSDLARALLERDIARDAAALEAIFSEAERAHPDPLDAFLEGLGAYAEAAMEGISSAHPGCLIASFTYEAGLIDADAQAVSAKGMTRRRATLLRQLQHAAAGRPGAAQIDLDALADMALATFQGALVVNKLLRDRSILPRQIALYQDYIRQLFADAALAA